MATKSVKSLDPRNLPKRKCASCGKMFKPRKWAITQMICSRQCSKEMIYKNVTGRHRDKGQKKTQ